MEDELAAVGVVERDVLAVVVVVEDDAAPTEAFEVGGVARDAGRRVGGELARPAAFEELDLAVARELEVLGDRQGVDEGDPHPFARLVEVVDHADDRQVDRRRRHLGEVVAGVGDDDRAGRAGGDLGVEEELRHHAGDPHPLALGDRCRAAVAEDEDALGGQRIGVGVAVLLLEEEAGELRRRLEVGR